MSNNQFHVENNPLLVDGKNNFGSENRTQKNPSSATTHKWLTEKTILGPKIRPKSPYRRPQPNKWWTEKKIWVRKSD